ncbi:MAG: Ig-like domain-containing protein, partial [Paramuribaculum sp.]|nr:Ig-like domain-containing protein [Paramuribaculum sp.]
FKDMTSLTKLTFGPSVLKIPESIFAGCSGISSLTIPKSVSTIGKNAFAGCTGIKTLRFEDGDNSNSYPYFNPHTVTIVMTDDGRSPFADSPIESLYVGVNLDCTVSPFKGSATLKSVKFGEFVGRISDDCFDGCSALTDIEFPVIDRTAGYKNDRIIGRKAFANCTKLKGALSIPTVITAVEDSAFINCSGITKINIEGNKDAKTLPFGKGTFAGTPANTVSVSRNTTSSPFAGNASLNDLTIGEMVTALEPDAFNGCTAISKITSESATPPTLQVSGFDTQTYDSAFLFVPDYTVSRYEAAQGWKNFTIFGKNEVLAKTVTISADKAELFAGSQMSLTAAVLPVNTRYKTITWKSSDESVATVDQSGNISAIKPGTATVTASTVNRITASCTVTVLLVPVEATAIAFPEDNVELTQGESVQLTVLFTPEETTERELTWSCDNCDIATVDETGTVTALIPGTATVTTTTSNGLTASCTVTVLRRIIYAESISLDRSEAELIQGESVRLTATVSPDNTDNKTVIWSSSDEAVATVDATGLVSALLPGKATVTATTSNGLTASCTVTVIPPVIEADGITLNITQTEIYTDETLQLMATVSPDDTTDKTVTWSSSNGEIATVDENGLVSPISEGKTTITATTANGLTASCEVTVLRRIVI